MSHAARELEEVVASPAIRVWFLSIEPPVEGFAASIKDGLAVIDLPHAEDPEVIACPSSVLPLRIAELCDLGPRPRPGGPAFEVAWALADVAFRRADEQEGLDPVVAELARSMARRWVVVARGREGPPLRLDVVDCGDRGLWLLHREGDRATFLDAVATDVWRLLTSMLSERGLQQI